MITLFIVTCNNQYCTQHDQIFTGFQADFSEIPGQTDIPT